MEHGSKEDSAFRVTMAHSLRPLMNANFLLGISSFTINSSGHIHHPYKIFNRFRVVITLFIILYSSSVTLYRMVDTLLWNPNYAAYEFGRFNKMVELICQFVSNVFPTMLICIGLFKSSEMTRFFQEMGAYNAGISEFADPKWVGIVTRRIFVMHLVMIIIMLCTMQLRVLTSVDPAEVEWWESLKKMGIAFWGVVLGVVLMLMLMVLKLFPVAYLECFNVALATCFTRVIGNLGKFILEQANNWESRYLGYPQFRELNYSEKEGMFSEKLLVTDPAPFSSKNQFMALPSSKPPKPPSDNHIALNISTYHNGTGLYDKENKDVSQMTPGQQVCYVVKKLQRVAKMQNATNSLFGSILALDIGFTGFMMVLLKYLLIRNMGSHVTRLRKGYLANSTMAIMSADIMQNDDSAVMSTLSPSSRVAEANDYQTEDILFIISPYGWLFFLTFDACSSLRLIVLTKCLGNVHSASLKINGVLSKVLGKAQRLVDLVNSNKSNANANEDDDPELFDSQRKFNNTMKNGSSISRPLITSVEANTVLAFLTVNSSQPIAFSAVDLITFSGSTILLIGSVIISYVVFLLQA